MGLIDGGGDVPRAGVTRTCGRRFGLVLKSTPTKQQSQLSQDKLHVAMGVEGLSISGVYEVFLGSSPGHSFLDKRVSLNAVSLLYGF